MQRGFGMKIVMIHGIGQANTTSDGLRLDWIANLKRGGADPAKLDATASQMAHYADLLSAGRGEAALFRMLGSTRRRQFFRDVLTEMTAGVQSQAAEQLRALVADPLKQLLEPTFHLLDQIERDGLLFLFELIDEVYDYLLKPSLREAIDARAMLAFGEGQHTVICHSLGTIVAFRILHKRAQAGHSAVRRLITFGSPLSFSVVRAILGTQWTYPPGLGDWYNVYDPRDPVCMGTAFPMPAGAGGKVHHATVQNSSFLYHQHPGYLDKAEIIGPLMAAIDG